MNPEMMTVIFGTKNLVKVEKNVSFAYDGVHILIVGLKGRKNIKISLLVDFTFCNRV